MSRVKVVMNPRGVEELLNSDDVHRGLEPVAQRILEKAIADAPVASGEYKSKLHMEDAESDGVRSWRVTSGTDHDIFVEAETGNLSRALDAGGGP